VTSPAPVPPRATVVICVYTEKRWDDIVAAVGSVAAQDVRAAEVLVVVDHNPALLERARAEFGDVRVLANAHRQGLSGARNTAVAAASGDVVVFLDDDAAARPGWLRALLTPYADPDVVAVGGRADNGIPGEEHEGLDRIGRLLPDGRLTGSFAADPGRVVEVDHLLGANMSFRRSALVAIGGIRGNYPGTCLCEESDISLRVRAAGGRLVYQPRALVRHVAAPYQTGGQRFDRRYLYYARRNHLVLLVRNLGWRAPVVRHFTVTVLRSQRHYLRKGAQRLRRGQVVGAAAICSRAVCELVGLVAGVPAAARARAQDRRDGVATPWERS
jgi:GT2 family glycosyltransferase